MSSFHTFERHVFSSAPDRDTPDRSWRAYARSAGCTIRDSEVPWVLGMAQAEYAPTIGGGVEPEVVLEARNFHALGRAFFRGDERLRYSLWGAVAPDPTGRWKWRIVTHTLDFDLPSFQAIAGYPEGLVDALAPSAAPLHDASGRDRHSRRESEVRWCAADWFCRFTRRSFDGSDETLSPLRVVGEPLVRDFFAAARLTELRRLSVGLQGLLGGVEQLTSAITDALDALYDVVRGKAKHVVLSGYSEAAATRLAQLVWLALPGHERQQVTFSTAPLDLEAGGQVREVLLVAPERWDGSAPPDSIVLTPDAAPSSDRKGGRRLWAARLASGGPRLDALAHRIEVRRLRLVSGDDLALDAHLSAWRERWWQDGPTVDLAWKLVSLESADLGRDGRGRVRAAGSALGLAVLREGGSPQRVARRLEEACTSAGDVAPWLGRGAIRTLTRFPRVALADVEQFPTVRDEAVVDLARRAAGLLWCRLVRVAGPEGGIRRLIDAGPPPLDPMLGEPGGPGEALLTAAHLQLGKSVPAGFRLVDLPGQLVTAAVPRMDEHAVYDAFDTIIGTYRTLRDGAGERAVRLLDSVTNAATGVPVEPVDAAGLDPWTSSGAVGAPHASDLFDDIALRWFLPICEERREAALIRRLRAAGVLRAVIGREDGALLSSYLSVTAPAPADLAAAIDDWLARRPASPAVGVLAETLADTGRLSALVSHWMGAGGGWPERLRLTAHPRAAVGWEIAERWLHGGETAEGRLVDIVREAVHQHVGRAPGEPAGALLAAMIGACARGGGGALEAEALESAARRIHASADWLHLAEAALAGAGGAPTGAAAEARSLARVLLRRVGRAEQAGELDAMAVEALLRLEWAGTRDGSAPQLVEWLPRNEPAAAPYVLMQALERDPPVSLWPALRRALAGCADGLAPEHAGRLRRVAPAVYAGLRPARVLYVWEV